MRVPRLFARYAIVFVALTVLLTFGFALGGGDRMPTRVDGIVLTLLMPGAVLRPDAWLYYHSKWVPLLTAAFAAVVWVSILCVPHMLVNACLRIARRPRMPGSTPR
jgi:hypothetical protein